MNKFLLDYSIKIVMMLARDYGKLGGYF